MADHIPAPLLTQLSDLLAERVGWSFPPERWHDLKRGIGAAAHEFRFTDVAACIEWLLSSPLTQSQIDVLAGHLTVGETYFFREQSNLELLVQQILPDFIQSRQSAERRLRIWSAACCTGEEPYSLAILLHTAIPNLQDWQITILGTDINPRFLHKAAEGVYSEWSFRSTPTWIRERYFHRTKTGHFALLPHIKKMVTFSVLNLVEDGFPSPLNNTNVMDIILCRNVFIYFSPERVRDVLRRFHRSLVEGGWLIVGPSEAPHLLHSRFTAVNFPGTTFYRKTESHTSPVDGFRRGASSSFLDYTPHLSSPLLQVSSLPSLSASVTEETSPSLSPAFSPPLSQMGPEPRTSHAKARSLLEEAVSLYAQGCYADTIEQLRGLLFTPESLNTHSSLDAQATALLVRAYANQGQLVEAQEWCQKAVANTPLHPLFHYLLATILLEQDRTEDAWLSLKRTLYLDPDFVLAHFLLGNLAHRQQQGKEARRHFTNARRLLQQYRAEDIVPESDGLTAGRLLELIATLTRT